jgi:hypothetical protein
MHVWWWTLLTWFENVKWSVYLIMHHAVKTFLTLALDRGKWTTPCFSCFLMGKRLQYHLGRWLLELKIQSEHGDREKSVCLCRYFNSCHLISGESALWLTWCSILITFLLANCCCRTWNICLTGIWIFCWNILLSRWMISELRKLYMC